MRSHTLTDGALRDISDLPPPKKRANKYKEKIVAGSIQEELEEHENSETLVHYKRLKQSQKNVEEDKVNIDELMDDDGKN
eukprot:CAMPEP_0202979564 /NCGR_PEP_ID=MMETSP1396-20130829/85678_1 /ASSEMBLY_ACC=CAM_ASM_000872 /TAXON_ID= /ORGANISM="Pseudokeronopsis sp., Strain Brazil" /LENGTH=79 /DNA_ID=CAMNT_0049719041 /DNA_START=60 /DNA_END=299 /DNA_ORIENTATION=+